MKKKTFFAAASLFVLTACVSPQPDIKSANVGKKFDFNYQAEKVIPGLVRTFELNGNTTLQFRNLDGLNVEFYDNNSRQLTYKVIGQYAVLEGVHPDFLAVVNDEPVKINKNGKPVVASQVQQSSPADYKSTISPVVSDDYVKREMARLQAELVEIKNLLKKAQNQEDKGRVEVVRYQFKNNSDEIRLTAEEKAQLTLKVKQSKEIVVKGYTDGSVANRASERLAQGRALAAKQLLISLGVPENKIVVQYFPSGGFVADNSTSDGRERNRRVEIALI
jgi:outer membrane protein OmpA-like peptidoglycan-associated protein